tara:strand:+ start:5568 stop:6995 length:1428 start_codon:yes stop_codon:yes gene_type:complete
MISLKYIKNQKFNENKITEFLFYAFPLCFIMGNLAVSLNTLIFIILSLWIIKKQHLPFRFHFNYWILIAFFSYFFLLTAFQFLKPGILNHRIGSLSLESNPIFKSFLLLRFLLLIFVIDTLFYNKILNLNKLFLSTLFCTTFVSFDVILQFITGSDIFGYKSVGAWNSGPFGEEFIAGSYLKNFSFFSFFYLFSNLKEKKYNKFLLIFFITLHLSAIFFSGNRMPLILFIFGYLLIMLLIKNSRFVMSISFIFFLVVFFATIKNNVYFKNTFSTFLKDISISKKVDGEIEIKNENIEEQIKKDEKIDKSNIDKSVSFLRHSGHSRVYRTAIVMWKEKPLTGFGLKSFRIICWEILNKDINEIGERFDAQGRPQKLACANHAHNYYLELLSEAGIIGIFLIIAFFIVLLKNSFNNIVNIHKIKFDNPAVLLSPVIIMIFLELWPIRSSGSFFTTWNATFFWICIALLIQSNKKISK